MAQQRQHGGNRRRSLGAGALVGIGLMAGIDEIVFHQILAWHHFYDRATPAIGLLSDGLLHAAELVMLVAGFFLLNELRGRGTLVPRAAWAGGFLGAGGFQLFDGVVNHKILRLHQIRYVEPLWPYDLTWIASALLLLAIGALLARRHGRAHG
ncbi:DUF2243 domain-containing protein [Plastorhodobacter daqingensis]|uniref:DUF2243 domain-containing protein n=1 Tax=Plastorhodobacter daqingensis TaxID=1387281 RepID=A0ABW2UJD6_9RHOB